MTLKMAQAAHEKGIPCFLAPIKHFYRKNQRIFGVGLANHLILLMPKFMIVDDARKIWCGKYVIQLK
jgi:hypothetical protein